MQILIPAAGASSRMAGRDKLAETIEGEPLLRRMLRRALATGAEVIVTLRVKDPRLALIADLTSTAGAALTTCAVPDAAEGLAASLRLGASGQGGLMILPADMPDITTEDLAVMIAAHRRQPGAILRATDADGTPGHPVVFPADLRPAFAGLAGDEGARSILRDHAARLIFQALPAQHATTDLDTPEAWAGWHARKQSD